MANKALKAMGVLPWNTLSLVNGAAQVIKAASGLLFALHITNKATAVRFVKLYDATSATVGTETPVAIIGIPGNSSDNVLAGLSFGGRGLYFDVGICIGAATAAAVADVGAPTAGDLIVNAFYK